MSLKFGTSGLRGLVTQMTPEAVAHYTRAFLASCDCGQQLCVGRDLRPSSHRIAEDVIAAARQYGTQVVDCAELPTPALALEAQARDGAAIMVTGSHIPADRNGLKFYSRRGEITKADEAMIVSQLGSPDRAQGPRGKLTHDPGAATRYIERYVQAFGPDALAGLRVGLYAHSAVGRDHLARILTELGAEVIETGRSDSFIPVDTEAVDPETRRQIAQWVKQYDLDALVSTDGDSDRPLLADEAGRVIPGDILGQITAGVLNADVIATPISSNSGVTLKEGCRVQLTQIGSPFVIAAMQAAEGHVVGYEANGGFLLGFEAQGPAGPLPALVTRDCTLPILATLYDSKTGGIAARVAKEPPIVTLSDRLQNIPQEHSQPFVAKLATSASARRDFLAPLGHEEARLDVTDGVRMVLNNGSVVHIRPSGNAPELRLYVEAREQTEAQALMSAALDKLRHSISR